MTLEDKKIILTGASSGIGLELLRYFIKQKSTVFASSRNERELTSNDKQKCNFELLDLSNTDSVKRYVNSILKEEEKIDILINNAGVAHNLSFIEEIKFDELNTVIKDNLMPTFNMIKYIIPVMKKNNSGIIINLASRAGRRAVPRLSAYSAAKFAVRGLTEAVAKEIQNTEIKCISISPAGVNTEMRAMVFGKEDAENQQTTSRITDIITKILTNEFEVPNGSDVIIIKDKEPIIKVPEV